MYELEIRDSKNKVVKTYSVEETYISDIFVEENLVTLNRVTKSGDTYTGTKQDYISNNEVRKESNITLESYTTDLKEKQMRLTYADGIEDQSPKILRPKQVMLDEAVRKMCIRDRCSSVRWSCRPPEYGSSGRHKSGLDW